MPEISASSHDRFEKATFTHVVTLDPDGRPHATPVWIDYDAGADRLLVNTERCHRKTRDIDRDPTVAVSMTDPGDRYRCLSVTGTVEEITTEGAREHIDRLSQRYSDESYPSEIKTERVLPRIRSNRVLSS
ncbi:PPOX class F420-dependent enzyme [Halobacteriales archaeon QH_10_67_13]|nr:MAG: PPOX class F420-dependent enzyme [Halobacteriales archaeon QH_10_67_13]